MSASYLTKVYPPEGDADTTELDLIAVHGLGADPKKTWVAKDAGDATEGVTWLSDPKMMPAFVPNARIWTFNYSSDWLQNSPVQRLRMLAEQLLTALDHCREQALTSAGTANGNFQHIIRATTGAVFLGTPFRGSDYASWARVIANSAKVLGFKSSDSLLKDLTAGSEKLTDLLYDFSVMINRPWLQLTIVCFYEQLKTRVIKDSWFSSATEIMVVGEASACIDGHRKIPLATTHTKMNKFGRPDDGNFQLVAGCIHDLAKSAPDVLQKRYYELEKPPKSLIPEGSLRECLAALFQTDPRDDHMQIRETRGKRADGTCEWVLRHESFSDWYLSKHPSILWINGAPAMGKTMIASFLVDEMNAKARQSTDMTLAYYFCDSKDERRNTAGSILRSLLMQILQQRPEVFMHLKPEFDIQKAALFTSGNAIHAMWRILRKILGDANSGDVYCIIDALDECEAESRQTFINYLEDLFNPSFRSGGSLEDTEPTRTKILITSRPLYGEEGQFRGTNVHFLRVETDTVGADVEKFIEIKVNQLAAKSYSPTRLNRIKEYLKDHAEGTFLWVSLVLDELSRTPPSMSGKKLSHLPTTLNQMYERSIDEIDSECIDVVRKILLWITTAVRPLTTRELATAAMSSQQADISDLPEDEVLKEFLADLDLCRPLVQVREKTQTVHFIHQTAKDYLVATKVVPPIPQANFAVFLGCSQYLSAHLRKELSVGSGASLDRGTFLGYACAHWPQHARISGDEALADTDWARDWFLRDPEKMNALFNCRGPNLFDDAKISQAATFLHVSAYLGLTYVLIAIDSLGLLDHDTSTCDELGRTPLHWAAEMGYDETARLLLQMGSNTNVQDNLRDSPLHVAIAGSHEKAVEVLLEGGANPNLPGRNQQSPLHLAAEVGDARVIKALLAYRADANSKLPDKTTPLHLAAQWGNTSAIMQLLSADADVNALKPFGESALHAAVSNNHVEATQALLERGANVNALTSDESSALEIMARDGKRNYHTQADMAGWTPLHIAALKGHHQICEMLLFYGANPASPSLKGKTPLQVAVDQQNEGVIELFMQNDSSLTANDILQAAIKCRSRKLVEGFCVDPSDWLDVKVALSLAAQSGDPTLVEMTCDKFTSDQIKRAAFDACSTAIDCDKLDILEMLLEKGADVRAKGPWRRSLLHLAVKADNIALATVLTNNGADVSAQDGNKHTPLHMAVENNNTHMVSLLLRAGTPVDLEDVERWTALHFAAHAGASEIVAILVDEAGADMEKKDADGKTALDLATAKGHVEIRRFLEDRRESVWVTDDADGLKPMQEDRSSTGRRLNKRVTASGQRVMSGPRGPRARLRRNGRSGGKIQKSRSSRGTK